VQSLSELSVNFAMAMMIIILAGFNYTNLTLARSLGRAKEVGIRKTSGATRFQLICQFICESILVAAFALLIGYAVLQLMEQYIHVDWITWKVENQVTLWIMFIGFTLLVGILAGILPAWILSGFQPVKVLKGFLGPATVGKIGLRKSIVVIQFVVTACFVFIITHMYSEFNYMATDNENFNRKNIYHVSMIDSQYNLLKHEFESNKQVDNVGFVSTPFGGTTSTCAIKPSQTGENILANYYAADAGFIENMQLKFVAGKNMPTERTDSVSPFILLNEMAVKALGLGKASDAIGKSIYLNNQQPLIIGGVLKDFCYSNYQFAVQPVLIQHNPASFHVFSIKTKADVSNASFTADMKKIWKQFYPHDDMSYSWYEKELYDRYYPGADMKFMGVVSLIIFVIAIMGLLGMVTYTTEKRIKEIGIRKVMGATVMSIVRTLSWSFVKLLIIAVCIALPLGYLFGLFFLNIFTFHPPVDIGLMGLMCMFIFSLAIFTIALEAFKAARSNPVKSLRTE
jgi:putative ABC transport system permease protein